MDEIAKEYEKKLEAAYNDLSITHMRPMMKKTYQCSADCCDVTKGSYEDVQRCINDCASSLVQAQTYLKNEFQDFQNQVQRCLVFCNDSTKAKMEKDKVTSFSEKYRQDYEACAIKCLESHGENLPSLLQRIKSTLDTHSNVVYQ